MNLLAIFQTYNQRTLIDLLNHLPNEPSENSWLNATKALSDETTISRSPTEDKNSIFNLFSKNDISLWDSLKAMYPASQSTRISKNIDAVYVINLDGATKRWEAMQKELGRVGLLNLVKRVSAVKSSNLRGSWESHRLACLMALESNYKAVVILEDDAYFTKSDVITELQKALQWLDNIKWFRYMIGYDAVLRNGSTLAATAIHAQLVNVDSYCNMLKHVPFEYRSEALQTIKNPSIFTDILDYVFNRQIYKILNSIRLSSIWISDQITRRLGNGENSKNLKGLLEIYNHLISLPFIASPASLDVWLARAITPYTFGPLLPYAFQSPGPVSQSNFMGILESLGITHYVHSFSLAIITWIMLIGLNILLTIAIFKCCSKTLYNRR